MHPLLIELYYRVKPLIPRRALLALRRERVARLREGYAHVWPIDPRAGESPPGWQGWPDGKRFALVLTHDVETAEGQARCRQLAELEMGLGFRSSFNFVAEDYPVDGDLRRFLLDNGFEVGVHGLNHTGNLFGSFRRFLKEAPKINRYLMEWGAVGFRAPSMYRNLDWTHLLDISYDSSSFDTDPFEPQPDASGTIFPTLVKSHCGVAGYVELPYTLPQDHTLFLLLRERDWTVWREKIDWIARNGGMALLDTHADYMDFDNDVRGLLTYPVNHYRQLLSYLKERYPGQYWHTLPRDMACFWSSRYGTGERGSWGS